MLAISNNIKETSYIIKSMKWYEKLCLAILIIQIIFITYTNFFLIPNTLDNDAAKLFLHTIEIWKNKKIFLPNWVNQTTLEIDCAALLAFPFYGIFKNIYIAFGLSNLTFIFLYIYILSILLKRNDMKLVTRIITYIFMLIPFSFGQLLYYNMMFFAGGQYVVKVLVPLMYIVVLTSDEIGTKEKIIGAISIILTFIMGVSSGPYVLASGIAPIVLGYLLCDAIKKKSIKELFCIKSYYIVILGFFACLGELICIKKHVNTLGNSFSIIPGLDITKSFFSKFSAFFELFGGFSYDGTKVLSLDGIMFSFKCVFALILLIICISAIIFALRSRLNNELSVYILCIFTVNFFVLWFTDTFGTARYLLVFIIPLHILVADYMETKILCISDKTIRTNTFGIVLFIIFLELIICNYQVLNNKSFPYFAHENTKYELIVDFLNEQPEEHVFVVNDNGQPEIYRMLDLSGEKEYLVYLTDTQTIEVHDYYWSDEYYSWLNDGFLLVGCDSNTSIDMMPEEIRERSEHIGQVHNYYIYRVNSR